MDVSVGCLAWMFLLNGQCGSDVSVGWPGRIIARVASVAFTLPYNLEL